MYSLITAGGFAAVAVVCFLVAYFAGGGSDRKIKACTAHTMGLVTGWSHITSNDIQLPKVEYTVDGEPFSIAGPRFAGATMSSLPLGKGSATNLTVDGPLPDVVHMTRGAEATFRVMAERYPAGKEVDVYYDPKNPKRAYVERCAKTPKALSLFMPLILGIMMAAVALFFLIVRPI